MPSDAFSLSPPVQSSLLGGKAKKKKKKPLTGKIIARHKHKTVKLAILKYFQVEGEGDMLRVTRTRMECPNCGPGVYLAKHKDRRSCGKCGLALNPPK
mmetsp:Transcript_44030/g.61890  ORF Transcript_44030/g.61890 Transcript_44030/m.61890 type:complete len:98 (-) Transcript_44030:187-480(-)